ncbi:MAG: GNAT family N-acetyltransferase, partial [Verrucomicrobia bacterium]|nr:GNAT family N-acetyltransferase [Verrucomicrobiota bacterium]
MDQRCRIEVVDRVSRLRTLVEPWTELWACARFSTPFQHPGWILAFYDELRVQEPRILLLWKGKQLVMLAPFYLWKTGDRSTLVLAGNGVSDYLDILVRPANQRSAATALGAFTANAEWEVADLRDLDARAALCRIPWPATASDSTFAEQGCPRLALPKRLEDALASVSRAIRRDLERAKRKLIKMGALDVTATDLTTLPADYNQLVSLHTLRWQSAGSPGIFGTDYYRRFFLAAFTGLARAGLLRLLTIRLDGKPIAVTCGFAQRRHYYHFITGYDPEWSSLSPGTLAV